MAAAISANYFELALATLPTGKKLAPAFSKVGVRSISALLAYSPSFTTGGTMDPTEIEDLAKDLEAKTAGDPLEFKNTPTHHRALRQIIVAARGLHAQESAAIAAATAAAAAPAAPPTVTSNETAALAKIAGKQFTEASTVHGAEFSAHERVSYSIVGKLHNSALDRSPVAFALCEYVPQLRVTSAKKEEISLGDRRYIDAEGASKDVNIVSDIQMFEQMQLRCQADIVAGCFDVVAMATARGVPPPAAEFKRSESTVSYVDKSGATPMAASMDCYATPAGQMVQISAMQKFRKLHSAISTARVVTVIDVAVQRRIADLKMEGHTADSAVHIACTKCPELYSASQFENATELANTSAGAGGGRPGKKPKNERTPDEQLEAMKRALDNKERQIQNFKVGKGGGGKGKGKWPYQPPWAANMAGPSGYAPNGKGAGQPPGGARSGIQCPNDVCRNYNFKADGCPHGNNCRFKHTCAVCGADHPWLGNH
jgi:hypothetical protein